MKLHSLRLAVIGLIPLYFDAAHAQSDPYFPTGSSACPCIDVWAYDLELNANAPAAALADCDWMRSGDRVCYTAAYGASSCAAHDLTATPECSRLSDADRPAWCSRSWCWVDGANCDRGPASQPVDLLQHCHQVQPVFNVEHALACRPDRHESHAAHPNHVLLRDLRIHQHV
eukprot:329567-Prymnesium_polylepis.1